MANGSGSASSSGPASAIPGAGSAAGLAGMPAGLAVGLAAGLGPTVVGPTVVGLSAGDGALEAWTTGVDLSPDAQALNRVAPTTTAITTRTRAMRLRDERRVDGVRWSVMIGPQYAPDSGMEPSQGLQTRC